MDIEFLTTLTIPTRFLYDAQNQMIIEILHILSSFASVFIVVDFLVSFCVHQSVNSFDIVTSEASKPEMECIIVHYYPFLCLILFNSQVSLRVLEVHASLIANLHCITCLTIYVM